MLSETYGFSLRVIETVRSMCDRNDILQSIPQQRISVIFHKVIVQPHMSNPHMHILQSAGPKLTKQPMMKSSAIKMNSVSVQFYPLIPTHLHRGQIPEFSTQTPSAQSGMFSMVEHLLSEDLQGRHWIHGSCFSPLTTGAVTSKSFVILCPQALLECSVPQASCRKALY